MAQSLLASCCFGYDYIHQITQGRVHISSSQSRVHHGRVAQVRSTVVVFRDVHILVLYRGVVGSPEQTGGNFQ